MYGAWGEGGSSSRMALMGAPDGAEAQMGRRFIRTLLGGSSTSCCRSAELPWGGAGRLKIHSCLLGSEQLNRHCCVIAGGITTMSLPATIKGLFPMP
jgi:hypothetical protein